MNMGDNNKIKVSTFKKEGETSECSSEDDFFIKRIFFSKYKPVKKLGEGSFGKIYQSEYNGEFFALKFENRKKGQNLLESEAAIMSYLKGPNIPIVTSFGFSGDYNILVMQLLGKSLEDIIEKQKRFSLKTVCLWGIQMLTVLEYIHSKHIVHRDMKPDNFVVGINDLNHCLYLLDFGWAKKYRSSTTWVQYPMTNKKKWTGTARYASINALKGYEQSRRDDLEAAGYVLLYFLRGSLPWQGLQAKSKEDRYKKILEKKIETKVKDLCAGFPEEFTKYIEYTKGWGYTDDPNYQMWKDGFAMIWKKNKWKIDNVFDWTTKEDLKARKEITWKTDVDSHSYQHNNTDNTKRIRFSKTNKDNNEYDGMKVKTEKGRNIISQFQNINSDIRYSIEPSKVNVYKKVDTTETKCCVIF